MKQDAILQKLSSLEKLLKQNEKPLSFLEAAKYLDISSSTLYKLSCRHLITCFKPNNKKLYFKKSDLDKWIFRNQKKAEGEIEQEAINYLVNGEVQNESN